MSFVIKLRCSKCGKEYSPDERVCLCTNRDDGRLDIYYDYESIANSLTRSDLERRSHTIWRYRELLPVRNNKSVVTLGEGGTPLILSKRLAEKLKMKTLYLKDEGRNPTGSFKDRSMCVGISKAIEFGANIVATASSGNAAASLAAYAAKEGLDCYAFVLEITAKEKIAQLLLYGAKVVKVRGLERGVDPSVEILKKVVDRYGWYPCPSMGPFNPYQMEGVKTMAYEIAEQMRWKVPDWVIVQVGCGCLLVGIWKGFRDLYELGYIERIPRIAGIQSSGNAPLVRAFKQGKNPSEIEAWERPNTIAGGLADPFPWDGGTALTAIRKTNGVAEAIPDKNILEAERLLALTEGIFAEPSGVTSLAGLAKLLEERVIDSSETVVALVTGSGLKDPEVIKKLFEEPPTIQPLLEEFEKKVLHDYGARKKI